MTNWRTKIYYALFFLISFIVALYFLDIFETPQKKIDQSKYNPVKDYSKLPSEEMNLNGKTIRVYSGVSNMPGIDLINKMKEDIANNSAFKLIHENTADNRHYLSYSENGVIISAVVTSHNDDTCNYQIYKADEAITNVVENQPKAFLAMPDAVTVLTLKGKGDKMIYSYTTKYTLEEIFTFYRRELIKTGYREEKVNLPEKLKIKEIESDEIFFIKDRKNLTISVSTDPSGNGMMVYIVGS